MKYKPYFKRKTIFPNRDAKLFRYFEWTWRSLIKALKGRLEIDKDALVLISGKTGGEKSELTGNLCLKYFANEVNFILGDGSKMFERENFITNAEEFAIKMISKKGSVLWVDEGRSSVNRRDWYSKMNKTIIGRKNRNRKLNNITFLLLPFEREVDPNMMGHVNLWCWVRRGVVEIYASSPDFKGSKGLDIQSILDRDEKYRAENPNCRFVPPYIHAEFIGRIFFKKLTPGYKAEYEKLVEEKSAVGELTEEEKLKMGMIEDVSPEKKIKDLVSSVVKGELTNKKEIWGILKKETKLEDSKLLKQLNFYLKLEDLPTFGKLFK